MKRISWEERYVRLLESKNTLQLEYELVLKTMSF